MKILVWLLETVLRPLGYAMRGRHADAQQSVGVLQAFRAQMVLRVTSEDFTDGAPLPRWAGGPTFGENISPQLSWSKPPVETRAMLLIIEDLDSPGRLPTLHTVAVLPADMLGLARGELGAGGKDVVWLPGSRGRRGYFGPRPLPGHGPHRYGFHLFALDVPLTPDVVGEGLAGLVTAVDGHVVASGHIEGTAIS